MSFVITTDSMCDLPESYLKEHDVKAVSLSFTIDGQTYDESNILAGKEFYDKMRQGAMPATSQFSPGKAKDFFEAIIKEKNCDILHISFSSGLSGSYNSALIAAQELEDEYPDRKITIVDSLAASLGEGLLVYYAVDMMENGKSMEEVYTWLSENKLNLCHIFTLDDLECLQRGGRVSKTAAVLGGVLKIKPLMHVDDDGKLVPFDKVRGWKNALNSVVDRMEKTIGNRKDDNKIIFISHGDVLEDAEYVRDRIKERLGFDSFLINFVGPAIGCHTGAGVVALFYLGEYR